MVSSVSSPVTLPVVEPCLPNAARWVWAESSARREDCWLTLLIVLLWDAVTHTTHYHCDSRGVTTQGEGNCPLTFHCFSSNFSRVSYFFQIGRKSQQIVLVSWCTIGFHMVMIERRTQNMELNLKLYCVKNLYQAPASAYRLNKSFIHCFKFGCSQKKLVRYLEHLLQGQTGKQEYNY